MNKSISTSELANHNTNSNEILTIKPAAIVEVQSSETDRANGKRRESFLSTLMRVMSSVSF
jgi:hypothetical protein